MTWISVYTFKVKVRLTVETCSTEHMKSVKLGITIGRCITASAIGTTVEENDEAKAEYRHEVLSSTRF
jgi:hypothetical protein